MFSNKYRYLYILALGVYSFLNIKFTEGDKVLTTNLGNTWLLCLILVLTTLIWESNRLSESSQFKTSSRLSSKLIFRFFLSVGIIIIISTFSSFAIGLALKNGDALPALKQIIGFTFRINLFLHCINAIYTYNKELSTTRLEATQLKKESTEAKLEALKSQVNPHFLFNNLNTLTSIIEENPKMAVKYVSELAKVYRYILKSEHEDLVSLREELAFLDSYVFLLKIRFQDSLILDIQLNNPNGHKIPPSTLQLLVENAIKHNEVSSMNPLKVSIFEQNDTIVVKNNINLRTDNPEKSGIGLDNITNRYALLAETKPKVISEAETFIVKLPIM